MGGPETETPANRVFEGLQHRHRRYALATLNRMGGPLSLSNLATHIAALEGGLPLIEVTRGAHDTIQADLHHAHLPKLVTAGLVEYDETDGVIRGTSLHLLQQMGLEEVTHSGGVAGCPSWDALFDRLANPRVRTLLGVLEGTDELPLDDLVRHVAAHEQGMDAEAVDEETLRELRAVIHHTDIPNLEAISLVEYDEETDTVQYGNPDAIRTEWLEVRVGERIAKLLDAQTVGVWSIDGRTNIAARGRTLFAHAEEELFIMLSTGGLLEPACIDALQDAIERGVNVYLGSQNARVREHILDLVPGVVIWEPQLDWLNLPPHREQVGRLVLADREMIMLSTFDDDVETTLDADETAITGEGDDNPLVQVLTRMLGSRLDHLDEQSEDFLSHIPL